MNDFKDLDDRFDKLYLGQDCIKHSFDVDGVCEFCGFGSKEFKQPKDVVKDFIHSAVKQAYEAGVKEGIDLNLELLLRTDEGKKKLKQARIEGARELVKKLERISEVNTHAPLIGMPLINKILSDLESGKGE